MSKSFVLASAEKEDKKLFSSWGVFRSEEIEREYRSSALKVDSYYARLAIAVSLLTLPFIVNDYLLHKGTNAFFGLLAVRALTLAGSLTAWFIVARVSRPRFDRILLIWILAVAVVSIYVVAHRPPGFTGVLLTDVFIVLLIYLLLPLPPTHQLIAAGALSLGHVVFSLWIDPIVDPVLRNTLVFVFVTANAVGFYSSRKTSILRRTQFALRKSIASSEMHYRSLVDASGSLVWTILSDGSVDFVNEPATKMAGSATASMTDLGYLSTFVHPDEYHAFAVEISNTLANGTDLEWTGRVKSPDGEFRWVLTRMVPLRGGDGVTEKWIGTTTDIHDLWNAKLLLKESNKELERTLSRVRQLEGLLSICSFCKKIRDENDQWQHLESYISKRSDARFSHGVCHTCGMEHYGDLWELSRN